LPAQAGNPDPDKPLALLDRPLSRTMTAEHEPVKKKRAPEGARKVRSRPRSWEEGWRMIPKS